MLSDTFKSVIREALANGTTPAEILLKIGARARNNFSWVSRHAQAIVADLKAYLKELENKETKQ
jgi:hypothetical protein